MINLLMFALFVEQIHNVTIALEDITNQTQEVHIVPHAILDMPVITKGVTRVLCALLAISAMYQVYFKRKTLLNCSFSYVI